MKAKNTLISGTKGFSLVELLVVIAVIAIIAAIAIPNIANITTQARSAKAQRNAQNLASVAAAARAAGYTEAWATETAVVDALTNGNGAGVTTNGLSFGVSGLTATDVTESLLYLDISTTTPTTLLYKQTTN